MEKTPWIFGLFKTDWYPKRVKPIRRGEYEARSAVHSSTGVMLYWNGWNWEKASGGLENMDFWVSEWRGLTTDLGL